MQDIYERNPLNSQLENCFKVVEIFTLRVGGCTDLHALNNFSS